MPEVSQDAEGVELEVRGIRQVRRRRKEIRN
jgi:hypothetical protein